MELTHFDRSVARPGQIAAIDKIVDNVRNGVDFTPIILPTGYGKSDVIRLAGILTHRLGLVPVSVIANVNTLLRDQIIAQDKVRAMLRRYKVPKPQTVRYSRMDKVRFNMPFNGDVFMSATIQLLTQPHQLALLEQWVESMAAAGHPPLLHIDEAHQTSQQNSWGSLSLTWRRAGGYVVLYTATPERHDMIAIPGIPTKTIDIEPVQVCRWAAGSTPEMIKVSVYDAMKQQVVIDMDYVEQHGVYVPFRTAWNENIICHVQRIPFDVDLMQVDFDTDQATKLSELSEGKTRQYLGRIVRDREAIYAGVRLAIQELALKRKVVPDAGTIVFCGNDNDQERESNAHAKAIEKVFQQLDPSLEVVIATSATGDEDTEAEKAGRDLIKAFAKGKGDVLIVKQMASVGLDIERLKVVLDLSPTRTAPSFIQRLNRATRPYQGLYVCSYVTPDDCIGRALFKRFVEDENGDAFKVSQGDLIAQFEKEKNGGAVGASQLMVNGANIGGMDDSKGKFQDGLLYGAALAFMERLPILAAGYTHNDVIEAFRDIGIQPPDNNWSMVENTSQLADQIRQDCVDKAKAITTKLVVYSRDNPELWSSTHRDIWNKAKLRAGLSMHTKLEDIREIALLRRVKAILVSMESEVSHA